MPNPLAKFAFRSPELEVEFEGHPDFIRGQIDFLKERVTSIVASARPGPVRTSPAVGATASASAESAHVAVAGQVVARREPAPSVDDAPASAPDAPTARSTALENPTLEQFYRRARSREGRGALQETILIFAYFLKAYREKEEFSIESLNACFSLVGAVSPKSLANTLGIMKRTQNFFDSGSQRGHYTLTETGSNYVKRLIGA
jgi:hypothetical protein